MKFKNHCHQDPRSNVGAVRGRNVYELTSRRQLVTGVGSSFLSVIEQRFPAGAGRKQCKSC